MELTPWKDRKNIIIIKQGRKHVVVIHEDGGKCWRHDCSCYFNTDWTAAKVFMSRQKKNAAILMETEAQRVAQR